MKRAAQQRDLGWSVAAAMTVVSVFVLSNAPTPLYVMWQREWGSPPGFSPSFSPATWSVW